MFKEVADIKTSEQLHLPVPDAKFETVVAKPSEIQKEMVQELSRRAAKIHSGTVDEKMLGMGIRSLSAYIRKMALDGYCLNLDLPQLRRMSYLLQNCSNNLNQVAKRVNESNQLYAADIEDLRQRLDELIDIGRQILSQLAEL